MLTRRIFVSSGLLVPLSGLTTGAASQETRAQTFPGKSVRIVVPYAAGGSNDVVTRVVAEQLQMGWQQPAIIENKAGASGNIGTEHVAHSRADGYTLLASAPAPLAVNRFLFTSLPFSPSDLTIVTVMASAPIVLVARSSLPVKNLKELMAYVKSGSRSLNYASSGVGGTPHLTMEWLKSLAGLDIAHVPFNGGVGPAVNDLLGGHVDLMFANLSDISRHLEDGRIKALALAGAEPIADLPGIEPISNQFPGFFATTWFALAAPSATPHSILEKIASDVAVALAAPNVVERLRNLYLTPEGKSPQVSAAFVEADTERWHSVIEKIGLKPV